MTDKKNAPRRLLYCLIDGLILICLLASIATGQDWPQWRGPARDGAVTQFTAPSTWPSSLKLAWKAPAGSGFSSPVVVGDRVYLHARRDAENLEVISCLDLATGKTIWEQSDPVEFTKNQYAVKMGKGPHSTPIVNGGRVYTLGVKAVLSCFDARTGQRCWRQDFSAGIDTSKLFCGTAMSPLIENGRIIVHVGDDRGGRLIAFDAISGAEKWRWEGDGPGYASPIAVELEGVRQIVTLTDRSVVGVAASDGRLLWRLPFSDEWNENIVTPILFEKTLIISGVRRGTMGLRIERRNDQWKVEPVWQNKALAMYMNSPLLDGHLLYGLSHLRKGQFFCLDARTGETLWTTEGRAGDNAAIVGAGDLLFALTNDANLIVARKSAKGFESIARYQVAESATWAHPVIIGRRVLVKDDSAISLWSW